MIFYSGNDLNIPDVEADVGQEEGRPLPGYGRGQAEAKSRVEALLTGLEVEPAGYRLGNTQVQILQNRGNRFFAFFLKNDLKKIKSKSFFGLFEIFF